MPDNPTENSPWREGERYDETMSDEPFDEEELDPEEAERRITQFVTSAEELPGLLEAIMDGKPHNKVLARQLLLGQRARGLQTDDPEQWHLYAASTLLSGIVIRGAKS